MVTCVLLETVWLDITFSGGNVKIWAFSERCVTSVISNSCSENHKCHRLGNRRAGTRRRTVKKDWRVQDHRSQTPHTWPVLMRGREERRPLGNDVFGLESVCQVCLFVSGLQTTANASNAYYHCKEYKVWSWQNIFFLNSVYKIVYSFVIFWELKKFIY